MESKKSNEQSHSNYRSNRNGTSKKRPFMIGIAGGTASGKVKVP